MAGHIAAPVPAPAVPTASRGQRVERNIKFFFLVPAVAYLLLLGIFPLLFSLFLVFAQWRAGDISWVGLDNLQRLWTQERFWNSLRLTIFFVLMVSLLELALGTLVALALQSITRGRAGLRLLFTLPMLLPPIAVSFTWKMLFDYDRGPVNHFFQSVGLGPFRWLGDHQLALLSVMIVDIWQWTPFIALGMLAALESMPSEQIEASVVDGAGVGAVLRDIILPMVLPYVIALVALRAIDAFKIIDVIFVLTGGGPGTATEMLTYYGYVAGFRPFNMGFTAAVAWSLVIIMTFIFFIFLRVSRRVDEEV